MFGRSKEMPAAGSTANQIKLIDGGPMVITGNFVITGSDGLQIRFTAEDLASGVAICRCGRSRKSPFCDGSHAIKL